LLGPTKKEAGIWDEEHQSWNIETSFLALVMDGDKLVTSFLYSRSLAVKR
jgi:hypothetical protein